LPCHLLQLICRPENCSVPGKEAKGRWKLDRTEEREMEMHAIDSLAELKQFRYPYFLGHGST